MNDLILKKENLPSNIEDLKKFILIGEARLKSYQGIIHAIKGLPDAKNARDRAIQDGQRMGTALLYAESKMGEMLKNCPSHTGRTKHLPENITHKQSHYAQKLANNTDLIEEVIKESKEYEDLPTKRAVFKKIEERERQHRIEGEKEKRKTVQKHLEIRKGDFKEVLKDLKNIDAIITDPPYPKEFLNCFSELSKYASEHLKENGFMAVYSGNYHIPEVIKRLSENLTYVWTFCLYHAGSTQLVLGVNIMTGWKPVFIFSKGKKKMRFSAYDVIHSEKREKDSHEWQQSESGVKPLIEILSNPGELIVDPFSGSGTFGKVSVGLGRKFIGAEIQ
jgi:hypothetical protein